MFLTARLTRCCKSPLRSSGSAGMASGRRKTAAIGSQRQGRGRRLTLEFLESRTLLSAGDLDPTFGIGGKVLTDVLGTSSDDRILDIAVQSDGKIVAVGHCQPQSGPYSDVIVRYDSDGTPDSTFGQGGRITLGSGWYYANSVAIQPDGKIVVAGWGQGGFAVARYNADGTTDTGFHAAPVSGQAFGVAVEADGKIVAAGYGPGADSTDFAVAR